jgi:hypothetical protein
MPLYWFHVTTPLSPELVAQRIRALTRPSPNMLESLSRAFSRTRSDLLPFLGEVDSHSFRLRRYITHRNTIVPLIHGSIQASSTGSEVRVTMFLQPFTAVFLLFWFSGVGMFAWQGLIGFLAAFRAVDLMPLAMLVFGLVLTLAGFFSEAFKAKRLLTSALSAATASKSFHL